MRPSQHRYVFRNGDFLPLCSLFLLGPGEPGRTPIEALVDSGASYSIFHKSAAEAVGIKLPLASNHPVQYGDTAVPGWRRRVDLELRGERWSCEVIFVERLAFSHSLLGRRGVFPKFREISFAEQQFPSTVNFR